MPPQQPYSPGPPPRPSQPHVAPHAPHLGYGSLPGQVGQDRFQQHPNGQYEVVAPPQPAPSGGQSGHNPYEFIFEADRTRAGRRAGPLGGASFRLVVVAVGGLITLLIVAALVINALAPKGSVPGMISIAQRQQELVRVADSAYLQATTSDVKNLAVNISVSVGSSQQQITGYLASHGTKLEPKVLALDKSTQTDTELAAAATANNYDSAVTQNLVDQLQTYEHLLQTTYKQTDNKTSRQLLQTTFNSADLLLQQGQATAKDFPG